MLKVPMRGMLGQLAIALALLGALATAGLAQNIPDRNGQITDAIALFSKEQIDRMTWSLKAVRARDGVDIHVIAGPFDPGAVATAWGLDPAPRRDWVLVVAGHETGPGLSMSEGIKPDDRRHALDWAATTGAGAEAFEAAMPGLIRAIQPSGHDEAALGFLGLLFPILAFAGFGGVIWLAIRTARR